MKLWPFFTFFGGKWRVAPHYPKPLHDTIVEPFAGSAGYAVRYHDRKVILAEGDPLLVALWRYLIQVSPAEIRALPDIASGGSVDDLVGVAEEARWLVGFWLNKGMTGPCRTPSSWMREGWRPNSQWGAAIRERIAAQVEHIRHWRVLDGFAATESCGAATWFIDPPYVGRLGERYRASGKAMNYSTLSRWCQERRGQVMVCENVGATWLPFQPFLTIKGAEGSKRTGVSHEALYYRETP